MTRAILLLLTFSYASVAQENKLFEFPAFQNAVNEGTRTRSGEPGPKYWQNSSDYTLEVTIDTLKNILKGKGTVIYHNNYPLIVRRPCIRLYQDLYKKGTVRTMEVSPDDLHDGTYIDSLSINGIKYIRNNKPVETNRVIKNSTTLRFLLKDSILSGGTGVIEYAWNFPIPTSNPVRMGHYSDDYFIGLWYPQISVLDDINSWDDLPHLGWQEFYNDFNNYDVTIKVPDGYMVWATGECETFRKS